MYDRPLMNTLSRLQSLGTAYCTVTIVDARGSIPQVVGACAVFGSEGLLFGTIGGGRVEMRCAEEARAMLSSSAIARTKFERLNLHRDVGMTCSGEVSLYYEIHRPEDRWRIVIFGAGHVAQKLCRFLVELECHTVCVDVREEWLGRLPDSDRLERRHVASFSDGIDAVHNGSAVLVMTMGQATDAPVLDVLARRPVGLSYLGVIGSRSKAAIMRRELHRRGVSQCFIDRIACPIGEKIGNNSPGEIAVGVLSQLLRMRHPKMRGGASDSGNSLLPDALTDSTSGTEIRMN